MATTDATPRRVAGSNLVIQTVVPVLDTSIYTAKDVLHTNDLKLTGMARQAGGGGIIHSLMVLDADDQGQSGVLWLFTAELTNTTHTANGALALHDTDAATCIGHILFGTYYDGANNQSALSRDLGLRYACAAGSTDLYAVAQTLGTPTHTASGLTLVLTAELL